jgi:hypothetical protein
LLVVVAAACASSALAASPAVTVLPRPAFGPPASGNGGGRLRLAIVSSQANRITDESAWFRRNGLKLPATRAGDQLVVREPGTWIAFRGNRLTVASGGKRRDFDFTSYEFAGAHGDLVRQEIQWAATAAGVLYVETSHLTYARSSGGRNAYLTAVDLRTGKPIWRSAALVGNARTFQVLGTVLVTGYGFTAEPDYLFLLDRATGKLVDRLLVPSAPEYVLRKGSRLYVRTYDHDLVAKLYRP